MADLQLIVTFDPSTGGLGIGGTPDVLGNQVLAFGMLEAAKQAIVQHAQQNERRVQPVSTLPPGFPVKP